MLNRSVRFAAALALGFAAPSVAIASGEPLPRVSDHVIIISIDGLRPDAIDEFDARNLERLMREGAYSLTAQTILPSKTLPSHTSMLTGVDVDEHGIDWNSDQTDVHGHVDVPTIFTLAHAAGYRTAAFFSKTKFHHLEVPQSLDHVRSPEAGGLLRGRFMWTRTVGMVEDYLESGVDAPNLMFVHIGEPDYAGHIFGWMSSIYGLAVREADHAVGEILDEANDRFGAGNYTLIVTADHGGHGREHGSADPRDTTIPWIVWGKGVQPGATLPAIRTMDTAATAMWMLGIPTPSDWVGKPVASAFDSRTLASTN
ncbi:MAG: alkaline phosphatase family protein [Gemmatimonadaceae bacterium]